MWNMYKVNNKTTKTTNIEHFSFEDISHLCSSVSIVNFEQVNTGWDNSWRLKAVNYHCEALHLT